MKEIPANKRTAEAAVDPLFPGRWSPRAFDPEPLPEGTVKSLFEAARWSPSCVNEQPWLFVYATTPDELKIHLEILVEGNGVWAKNAPLLAVLFARRRFRRDNSPNAWAGFDCGAAWMALALQARILGLYSHAMAGFNKEDAHRLLNVPESDFEAVCAIAVGKYGDISSLPATLKERETPNERKPLAEVAVKGPLK